MTRWQHSPPPTFCPPRDPRLLSEVGPITRTARLLGVEPMPHQRTIYDVATQYTIAPDGSRQYRYRRVLITLPRQSGKTTLLVPWLMYRLMLLRGASCWATAQTGAKAGARMKAMIETVRGSALHDLHTYRLSNGSEAIRNSLTGSSLTTFPPNESALHGETTPLVALDEIWAHDAERGRQLDGAIRPAMITLGRRAQQIMISTRGTVRSTWMNEMIAAARSGSDPDLCLIEWSLPEGADPLDPASWWLYHPALGNTIGEADIAAEAASLPHHEFLRAYGNVGVVDEADPLVPSDVWASMAAPDVHEAPTAGLVYAIEVAPKNAAAAIVASWRQTIDGVSRRCVRVVHRAPGTTWVLAMLADLVAAAGPALLGLYADGAGPVTRLVRAWNDPPDAVDAVDVDRPPIRVLGIRDLGAACEDFIAHARDERDLVHDGSPTLAAELAAAAIRTTNGVAILSRDASLAPIPAVVAAVVALWCVDHPDVEAEPAPPLVLV